MESVIIVGIINLKSFTFHLKISMATILRLSGGVIYKHATEHLVFNSVVLSNNLSCQFSITINIIISSKYTDLSVFILKFDYMQILI